MKLAWAVQMSNSTFAVLMRGKYLARDHTWNEKKSSTVWNGIKKSLREIRVLQNWHIGNGKSINLWCDHWIGFTSLKEYIDPKNSGWGNLKDTLSDCIVNGKWAWPQERCEIMEQLGLNLEEVPQPNIENEDIPFWPHHPQGLFTAASARLAIKQRYAKPGWSKYLWQAIIHPRKQMLT